MKETFGVKFDASRRRSIARKLEGYTGDHPKVSLEPHSSGKVLPIWREEPLDLARAIVAVVNDLHIRKGYTLTLRALYYQLVGRNFVPNHLVVYSVLSEYVSDMRDRKSVV